MPEMLQDINDVIIGRKTAEQIACESDDHDDSGDGSAGSSSEGGQSETKDDTRYAWRQSQVMRILNFPLGWIIRPGTFLSSFPKARDNHDDCDDL